jgi:peptidyl-prolyl cis-trans isomerase D
MTQLQQGIAGTAFVTQKQVESAAALAAQKRSFEYITLPLKTAMDAVTPTDQDIEKYFADHAAEFMTEEKVSIEYLDLNKAALTKDIQVEEAEVRAGYDAEAASFKPATERRAAHILIEEKPDGSEKAQLEDIVKKINAGEKFEALAKQFSSDTESAKQGGDVGFSNGTAFVPEFEQALAALVNIGDVSPPVKTEFGYHIIKLLEKRDTAFPSYEERKAAIEKQLRDTKAATVYAEKLDQMTESTYSAGDLAGPAAELKMDLQKTAAFGRRGGAGIASQQKIIDAAFSSDLLDSGKNSQVIELSADRAVVLRVSNHEISRPRELSDAKAEIVNAIKKEQAAVALKEKAEAIKGRVQSGANLAVVGADEKATLVAVNDKVRLDQGADAELVTAAFKLDKPVDGQVSVDAVQLAAGDWAILHLLAVNDIQPDKNDEAYKTLQKQLDSSVGNGDFATYEQSLRQKATIVRTAAENGANEKTD